MKFRVVEIHRAREREFFRPQYKPGWFFWYNI